MRYKHLNKKERERRLTQSRLQKARNGETLPIPPRKKSPALVVFSYSMLMIITIMMVGIAFIFSL